MSRGPRPLPPRRPEIRVGRRTIEQRTVGDRWRDVQPVAAIVGAAVVSGALFFWILTLLVDPVGGPGGIFRGIGRGGADPFDISVDAVVASLPDGRTARATFTLRLRDDAAVPRALVTPLPTATPERMGVPQAQARTTALEALMRERVNTAMSGLTYEDTAGEEGKARLKQAVRDAVNDVLDGAPVETVYLREYLVQ